MTHDNFARVCFIAIELADLTSTTWTATRAFPDDDNRFYLKDIDGFTLFVVFGGYRNDGRVRIAYSRVRGRNGSTPTVWSKVSIDDPSITVEATKEAAQIAKDIVRRLLTEARVVHTLALGVIAGEEKYEDNKTNLAKQIGAIVGVSPINMEDGKTPSVDPFGAVDRIRGDLRLGYGQFTISSDSVKFELTSVPSALALKLASVITETIKAHVASTK